MIQAAPRFAEPAGRPVTRARSIYRSRLALLLAMWTYAAVLAYAHASYLSYGWSYLGFSYFPLSAWNIAVMLVLVGLPCATMPLRVDRPSSLILYMLILLVFVPAVVINLGLRYDSLTLYGPTLLTMGLVFLAIGAVTQSRPAPIPLKAEADYHVISLVLTGLWLMGTVLLIVMYRDIMAFASLENIYDQRFSIDRGVGLLGYIRTYYSSVISPALIAFGLIDRRPSLYLLGVLGCLVAYMIDAQKTTFFMPFAITGLHFILSRRSELASSALAGLLFVIGVIATGLFLGDTVIGDFLSAQFTFRTLAVPGLTISQYQTYFDLFGYTWWTNLTGLNAIFPAPPAYQDNPSWPALGEMVGQYYYGEYRMVNANANPFSGEGIAAAGLFGLLVIGAALAGWLRLLDHAVDGWDQKLVLLLLVPIAMTVTNVHLSTVLVSFGGALFTGLFLFAKPVASKRPRRSGRA